MQKNSRQLGAESPSDIAKLHALRRMQSIALWLLVAMALVFAVSFALQDTHPAWGFVRAASEGGMVGAIADWFAVTALFRHPLGLKIPHTNLIARKKDDIGEGLGGFIEQNFLADEVVRSKLTTISGARNAGEWLSNPKNASKVTQIISEVSLASLTVLEDADVQELLETIMRKHVIDAPWSNNVAAALEKFLADEHDATTVDMLADHLQTWLTDNPDSFDRLVSSRLPNWLPGIASRFIDKKSHIEAIKFVRAVQTDRDHPIRLMISNMLSDLAHDLRADKLTQAKLERLKNEVFSSPRVRELVDSLWQSARVALLDMLKDPASELRVRITAVLQDTGHKLADDPTLQYKVDVWVMNAVEHLVRTYRQDLANVVTDTVKEWDSSEAAAKIELQIGKDLQYIRINGTVVGSLAGLTIYTIATLAKSFFM